MTDKVRISAYYEQGTNACHNIEVFMNYDGITARDVADAIRALFNPDALLQQALTPRSGGLGSTDIIARVDERDDRGVTRQVNPPPRVRFNGQRLEADMPTGQWQPGQQLRGRP